jgi:hypothetical protein
MTDKPHSRADQERAEKTALGAFPPGPLKPAYYVLVNDMAAAFAEVRREAWEEVAKVALDYVGPPVLPAHPVSRSLQPNIEIAAAIRALIEGSKP